MLPVCGFIRVSGKNLPIKYHKGVCMVNNNNKVLLFNKPYEVFVSPPKSVLEVLDNLLISMPNGTALFVADGNNFIIGNTNSENLTFYKVIDFTTKSQIGISKTMALESVSEEDIIQIIDFMKEEPNGSN